MTIPHYMAGVDRDYQPPKRRRSPVSKLDRMLDRACPRCRKGGVEHVGPAPDGRPDFRCSMCGHEFTCGADGGRFAGLVSRKTGQEKDMATPMQDPPAHEPDCLPPEPCVCAPKSENVTAAELEEVERLDKAATPGPWAVSEGRHIAVRRTIVALVQGGEPPTVASCVDHAPGDARLVCLARTLFPRMARALRDERAGHEITAKAWSLANGRAMRAEERAAVALAEAEARGRREAIEEAARYLRGPGHGFGETAYRMAATNIERHEAELARGSK